uniref:FAM3 metabolism regulating signaling molecule A n=1 Tax=Eptatretus burgeri TaxID=7764 RepID=A0A8C4QY61_EPTBU
MRFTGAVRFGVLAATAVLTWYITSQLLNLQLDENFRNLVGFQDQEAITSSSVPKHFKCGLISTCPLNHFVFRVVSGAASVVGPSICFEDTILMNSVKNNVGRGLNIALLNGVTGTLLDTQTFDMWGGDVLHLLRFLRLIQDGTVIIVATFDDGATKMSDEIRALFVSLGSSSIGQLAFRDNWVFVGAKGIQGKSPFEQLAKHNKNTNKYDGWPEVVEMSGCLPARKD